MTIVRGKFITIEGIEGAGKSTALNFINDFLHQRKLNTLITREPGGTTLAENIRKLILDPNQIEVMNEKTELLLMFAARCQHLYQLIIPALQKGSWVISDRFIDASYAYQGGGRNIPDDEIKILDKWVVKNHYPDLTLLLDVPPEVGLLRARGRSLESDRIEQETVDFFVRVRNTYLELAKKDSKRIKIVDASLDLENVLQQIREYLADFLEEKA